MDEIQNNQTTDVDLLQHLDTLDLTTVDRSFPVLKEGTYMFAIDKIDAKANSKGTGHNLLVFLRLEQTAPASDGKVLNPGMVFMDSISMVQTGKYNPLEKLADIQNAVYGEQRKGFRREDYVGRKLTCRVSIEDSAEFGARNRFRYIKAAKTSTAAAQVASL